MKERFKETPHWLIHHRIFAAISLITLVIHIMLSRQIVLNDRTFHPKLEAAGMTQSMSRVALENYWSIIIINGYKETWVS